MMTEEEKVRSEAREEGYRLAETKEAGPEQLSSPEEVMLYAEKILEEEKKDLQEKKSTYHFLGNLSMVFAALFLGEFAAAGRVIEGADPSALERTAILGSLLYLVGAGALTIMQKKVIEKLKKIESVTEKK